MLKLNHIQKQILWGTLLGKGYISKPKLGNNRFITIPEIKEKDWLKYKAYHLRGLGGSFVDDKKRLLWRTTCNPLWNALFKRFYLNDSKNVTMDILDELTATGLSTWFLDKGNFSKGKIALLTTVFGDSNAIICQYFNEVDMPCEIRMDKLGTTRILFTKEGTEMFLCTIARAVEPFMKHRLLI